MNAVLRTCFILGCITIAGCATAPNEAADIEPPSAPPAPTAQPYARVQTYSMLPIEFEKAAAKGWTVNGLWAGYGQSEAVRSSTHQLTDGMGYPPQYSYPTIDAYVKASHDAGLLVPGSVMGIAGHRMHRRRFPEMEQGYCVGTDGKRSYWFGPQEDGAFFMCANNPIYNRVLVETLKEALDNRVDLLLIDEMAGNELCFYWDNEPGFCPHCIGAYTNYLRSTYSAEELKSKFQIEDLETFDFAARLKGSREKQWPDTDPLFRELLSLQTRINFEARKSVVDQARTYMKEIGHEVPICGNVPFVGASTWLGGHKNYGVKFNQLLDFLAMECGEDNNFSLPRGKWVAYEKLAAAAYKYPSAIIHLYGPINQMEKDYLAKKNNKSIYVYGMFAEANANGCHYVNYFQTKFYPESEPFWEPCFKAQKFVRDHRELFEPKGTTGANVAVLYIENEGQRYRTESYVGVCLALAESNIPFDVVVDGGDGFVPVALTREQLAPYPLVILPNGLYLDATQKAAIENYAAQGGKVLLRDTEGFPASAGFVALPLLTAREHGEVDLAAAYQLEYDDSVRTRFAALVNEHAASMLEVENGDRTLTVTPCYQPEQRRLLLHVVNSDYDEAANTMHPKEDVRIRVRRPEHFTGGSAALYSPDTDGAATIDARIVGDFVELVVPRVQVYTVAVF